MLQEMQQGREAPKSPASVQPLVSSITLDASCCTFTHQQRMQLRQRLAAAADRELTLALEQKLLQDDPLLAGL